MSRILGYPICRAELLVAMSPFQRSSRPTMQTKLSILSMLPCLPCLQCNHPTSNLLEQRWKGGQQMADKLGL